MGKPWHHGDGKSKKKQKYEGWIGKQTKTTKRDVDDSLDIAFGIKPKHAKFKRSVWRLGLTI